MVEREEDGGISARGLELLGDGPSSMGDVALDLDHTAVDDVEDEAKALHRSLPGREDLLPAHEVVAEGRNYVEILRAARERGADLVALGAQGLGAQDDRMLGSTATRVLRGAACDVLIVRGEAPAGPLLVGVDGSPDAIASSRMFGSPSHCEV